MNSRHVLVALAGIVILVIFAYSPALRNQFVSWDDDAHFLANPFVQSFNLQEIFTTTVNGIYIPLTSPVALTNLNYVFAIFIFVILLWSLWHFRRNRLFVFANLFYILSIFFLLRADHNVGLNVVGDRFLYLPMLGWCMFLGDFCVNLWTRYRNSFTVRTAFLLAGTAVLSFLFFQTARQCRGWDNGAS